MKKISTAAAFLALATAAFAAAHPPNVYVRSMEPVNTADPLMCQSCYDARVVQLIYETPLAIDYSARPYRLAPGICFLPEVSEDALTYRFRLRPGSKVSPDDIAGVFRRLADPAVASPGSWLVKNVKSVRPEKDAVTVVLHEKSHVFPWLLAMSNFGVPLPDGSGTGPYTLASWKKGHALVFRKNDSSPFWRDCAGTNAFDEIRYLLVGDVSTQWLMFLKGETDFLGEISRDNWDAVITGDGRLDPALVREGVEMYSSPTMDIRYIGFNMRDPVLGKNKYLRQALSSAFDFDAWRKFYNNRIDRIGGPVPPVVEGCLDEPSPYSYNLDRARALLAKAGYPGGIDAKTGKRLVLTLLLGRATQDTRESGELLASFFDRIGVRLELEFCTWSAFLKSVNEGRMQLFFMGWVADYPDAENFLQLFHSKNVSPGANHAYYVNPEFDMEFDAAMDAADPEERNRRWRRCQEIVREDCPWIFTHSARMFSLTRPTLGNYIPSDFPYGQERFYRQKR